MVRGLDYYTAPSSELPDASGSLGAQDSLGGGSRYGNLFRRLGSPTDGARGGLEPRHPSASSWPRPLPRPANPTAPRWWPLRDDDVAVQAAALALAKALRDAGVGPTIDRASARSKARWAAPTKQLGAAVVLILRRQRNHKQHGDLPRH